QSDRERPMAMALRLLSGITPRRMHVRHSRDIRERACRVLGGVDRVLVQAHQGRFRSLARRARLDRAEICRVGARREGAGPVSNRLTEPAFAAPSVLVATQRIGRAMKYAANRPYADPEAAARKLIEIAAGIEPVQEGRIYIELINYPMLFKL